MELQTGGEIERHRARPAWDGTTERRAWARRRRRQRATLDAAEALDLVRAEQMKLHLLCGFVTINEYMERELGYGPHVAHERLRVARALARLPETAAALSRGELMFSAVRELSRVAIAETEADWLAASKGMGGGKVERRGARRAPGEPR